MLSKNNYKEELKKMETRNDHFSIRKLTVGTVSVLLGWTLINWGDTPVKADTTNAKPDKNPEVETDPNVVNESSSQIKKVKVEVETPKPAAKAHTENQNTTPQTKQAASQQKSTQKVTNSNPSQEKQTTSAQPVQSQTSNSSNLQQNKQNTQVKAQSAQPSTTNQANVSQAKQQTTQAANNADLIKQAKINTANKIQTNNTQQVKEAQLNIDKGALAGAIKVNLTNKENKVSAVTSNKIANEVQAAETAIDIKNVTPEFNVRNEADNYDLGVTVQKGQVIYGQVYIKNQNKYVTWATDQDNPGQNLYYYTTTGVTTGGQTTPNNATTQLAVTLNNSGNNMKGIIDTASAGTIPNSKYKGGEYNFSLSSKNGAYYQTVITGANADSFVTDGNSGSISWGSGSPIVWRFRSGFGDEPIANQSAPTWKSTACFVPINVKQKIYYVNADTGEVLGEKESAPALAGDYYDIKNADPNTISVDGKDYDLVDASSVSADVMNKQVTTVDGTPILVSDLKDGQKNSSGQFMMYNKGDVLFTLISAGPDYKLFVRKMLDNAGTAEYNTYTVDRSDVTPGAYDVSLDLALSRASVKKNGVFSGSGLQEQNVSTDGNSGLVFFYKPATPPVETTTGKVTYYDETDKKVLSTHDLAGNVGDKIDYTTTDTITNYENQGYQFVNSTFKNGDETYQKDPTANDFTVNFVHGTQTVTPDKPGEPGQPINPNDPDGPKWPDNTGKDSLEKDGSQTIHYEGAGDKTPKDNVENTTFTKTVTIDKVTGKEISSTDWTPSDHTFDVVKTPVVEGYHADKAEAGGFKSTPTDPNTTIVVTYSPNGKIIPVTPDGNPIPNVPNPPYTTNPDNPTGVTPDEPVPTIPDYTPEKNTITPEDPGKDTPVIYNPNSVATTGKVTYYDETDKKVLSTHDLAGNVGDKIDYTTTDTITSYENQGYQFVNSNFKNGDETYQKDPTANDFTVNFVHGTQTVTPDKPGEPGQPINPNDPDGPKWPDNTGKDSLELTGSQTIHYEGAGDKTPKDNVENTTFTKTVTIDKVTGKEISSTDWNPSDHTFDIVKTPVVEGYHADKAEAGGFKSTPTDPNTTIVVTYSPNGKIIPVTPDGNPIPNVPNPPYITNPDNPTGVTPDEPVPTIPGYTPEKNTITPEDPGKDTPVIYNPNSVATTGKVTYYDETDKKVLSTHDLAGNVGDKIDYTTTDTITNYENQGYQFVNSNFKNGDETYQKDPAANDFTVNFVHGTQTVTPDKPGEPGHPINPNDPDGPKWPDNTGKDSLEKTGSQTIHYEGAGDKTPKDNVENTTFTKTVTIDKVTGKEISSTDWNPSDHTFDIVKTPVVEGYHADKAEAGGFKSTPTDPNTTIVVTYSPNGKIIPVDKDGNPIPDAPTPQFPTNPDNPTTTTDGKIPSVPGYTPENGQPGEPVKPGTTPGEDVKVPYVKNPTVVTTTGKVTYYDETDKKILSTHDLAGNVGDKIDYTTTDTITSYENQGYQFVNSNFKNGDETYQKDPTANDFTVNFVHGTQTVTPDKPGNPGQPINPNDPDGPKWPDNTGKDSLELTGSQTIHYEGAGDKTPKDNVENTTFTKTVTIDKVTGKEVSSTDWTPSEHTFDVVKTPVVEGYHADKAEAGGFKSTPTNPNTTIVVTYSPNGKIIPVDPSGNPIPNVPNPPYTTNPNNPTGVTPNEPVPTIPGYTPEKNTVTPDNPGEDTPVIYHKNETPTPETGSVTVTYHDDTDNITIPDVGYQSGEKDVGTSITYNPDPTIKDLENKGYKLVPGQDINIPKEITKGAHNIVIHMVHGTTTVTPDKPGEPGQPINPNDPDGPKWPDTTGKDNLEKTGSQTIHYEGAGENTPKDNVQTTTFTRTATVDDVTGKVISTTDWTPSDHTFDTVKTPVVEGYHADKAEAGGFKSTPENPNTTIVVNYSPNGKIIPVDKDGNPIPDAPTPQFPTNPDNPTTTTDGKIPNVPGYTPENGQPGEPVKPGNTPADNVDVPYVKNPDVVATEGKVTYYDETDKKVLSTVDLKGNVGENISYTTTAAIANYENQGYKFVNSNFKNGEEIFQKDPSANDFTVNFVHGTQTVTPDKPGQPGQPINPNDPDGPKWPDDSGKDSLEKTGTQTIHYEGAGENTPKDNVQTTTFTRSATVDSVTGKVISTTEWTPSDHTFGTVKTPVVEGYHANEAEAGGFKSTPENPNTTITVTYSPNGKIIPVTPDGTPIPNVPNPPYTTTPDNPTGVTPNEPVPTIPGYTPDKSTITPENPGKDTPVIYHKNETPTPETGSVTVTFHDDTTNTTIPDVGYQSGEKDVGTSITYNPDPTIKDLENKGYKLVPGQDINVPKEITKGAHDIVIHMVHGTTTVTPDKPGEPGKPINPNDPNGPKWPEDTGKDSLEKTGTQTIHYEGAGNETPKDNVQTTTFTRSATVDSVTGKVISTTDWTPSEHTFGTVKTPVIKGYHANEAEAGGFKATPDNPNTTITVTYSPNGKIVPVTPDGNPIPNVPNPPYTTNPDNPTNVTPNEPVPTIPGYTPDKSTITPENPGKDTPVIYHKNETPTPETGSVTVTFHDDTTNTTIPDVGYQSGEKDVGTSITYSPDTTIKDLENKGYKLVPGQDINVPKEITKGAHDITIHMIHGTTTVTPDKPGEPGQPINPNDPNGPKWPDDSGKDSLEKTGTQTIHYEGAAENTPKDNVQTTTFTRTATVDDVTGKVISTTDWTPSEHTFGTVKTSVIKGYHANTAEAGGFKATPNDPTKTYNVTYSPNGKIIPVTPDGNPIPNVPNPPYTTNPDNPTNVTPNEPVPTIPGYTPQTPNVTPTNPGTDTKVVYTPNTPDIPVSPIVTTVDAKQTIEFVDGNGQEIHPSNVQTHTFTLTDGVSNESSYTFGTITVPVIKGYVAEVKTAGGKTVTPQDPDAKVVVVYHKIGKIIPVTSDGQQIPDAPTPQYQNDPNDPTKVEPNEAVPTISGYTPNETTVTPIDPTKDTQVIYTKNTTPNEPDNNEPDDNEPDEDDDNTPEPTKPHKNHPKNNSSRAPKPNSNYNNNIGPHSQTGNWSNNIGPHATTVNGWTNNIGPHGETVNANGQIIGPNGQVIGYVDKNGNPHYYSKNGKSVLAHATNANRKLPQTGESDQDIADAILAGAAVSMSLIGLAGVKRRKHE